jgi:6-phosphogluconolactonase
VPTFGAEPCYVTLNPDESWLAVANYGSGSIALFRLDEQTGLPLQPPSVRQNVGGGPVENRQDSAHAHCVCFSPDQRWLYHVDLGTDEVLAYAFDPATGSIGAPRIAFHAPAGAGPRQLVFHPAAPAALLLCELASTLTVLDVGDGSLTARQVVSTLPHGFVGESLAGHLSINAASNRAYVTNRGHDSIAVFSWDTAGVVNLLQHAPSGGGSPRSFVLLEREQQLIVANEEGGNVTVFQLGADGTLLPLSMDIAAPGAVFLLTAQRRNGSLAQ